ncbi:uncharacterized protein [Hetaerina americana]|uniref:uncharacterized protein n=1 Tax=Hetaerina americana TaxID=62018 RepID=UPI003A7F4265
MNGVKLVQREVCARVGKNAGCFEEKVWVRALWDTECAVHINSPGGSGIMSSANPRVVVTYTCGNVTSERVSYFVEPSDIPSSCSLTVNVYDRRVTQLRLDFERFSLEQPTRLNYDPATNKYPAYFCHRDAFSVSSSAAGSSDNLGFMNLCGENKDQHIYIPVNATTGSASVQLNFHLADRGTNTAYIRPQWRIRITQIDCCAPDTRDLCAPRGCLQYYPEMSGSFSSFNYNNGNGPYQGLLNYAICFKRYDGICSIRYDSTNFQIAATNLLNSYGVAGCNQPTTNIAEPNSQDYLFIPDARSTTVEDSYFCGSGLPDNSVSTNAPGPMYVFFRTDAISDDVDLGTEKGFKIQYSESASGCYLSNQFPGVIG